ncbi:MAG TPA: carboxypeptidase regulatory-like domain-containing protein [Verrucomicrobiae bacterium]|nr:carboxypeptidase regulatory-like domain-containing protein [Verrucomicrobiae bacterium]
MERRRPFPSLVIALAALALAVGWRPAGAGNTGNFQVDVSDAAGAPIAGATVTLTDPSTASFRQEAITDARGRAVFAGLPPRAYNFTVTRDGYQGYESNFLSEAGGAGRRKVTLKPPESGAAVAKETRLDAWAVAYNEAVALYRRDANDEALARLDAALKLKADFAPALALQGTILGERGKCEAAIPILEKALAADAGSSAAVAPLVACLDKSGRKDEAESLRRRFSASSASKSDLYNQAVAAINHGDDAAAAPLLEKCLAADPKFAPAVYQSGLVLFRKGDIAGAAAKLESYLALEPAGEFAGDARGLLKAIKP